MPSWDTHTCRCVSCKTRRKLLCFNPMHSLCSVVSSCQHHTLRKMDGQGPKILIWKSKSLEGSVQDKRLVNWAFSAWKWEDEENFKLSCLAETWRLSSRYKLVMWSVMSSTLCFCLVRFGTAGLCKFRPPDRVFSDLLSVWPRASSDQSPANSPQDPVLWPAFITTLCAILHGLALKCCNEALGHGGS